jgi:hypothetical protein
MNASRLLWKVRRRFKTYTVMNRIVSFGGVGSTSLLVHLEEGDRDRVWYHQQAKHCLHPDLLPEVRRGLRVRACYLFGDPYLSVISVFRRDLQRRLERTMSPGRLNGRAVLRHTTTMEEYLAGGVDRFLFGQHMDNWLSYRGDRVSILAVKHEALGEHIDEVLQFLGCSRPFRVRARSSRFADEPKHIQEGLESIYGDLKARIDGMPSLIRVNEG